MHKAAINIILITLLVSGCFLFSPEIDMGNGFYFVTINTYNRYIYRKHNGIRTPVVKATIVATGRFKGYSFTLRQPRIDFMIKTPDGRTGGRVKFERRCEFFIIDLKRAIIKGPLDISRFKKETSALNVCDKCLYRNTVSPPLTYCVDREDISPLILRDMN